MKYLFILLFLLFSGCQDVQQSIDSSVKFVKKTSRLIQDNSPKWVKQIKNGESIHYTAKRCYQAEVEAYSKGESINRVQENIYSQISREILSMVSSDYSENQTISNSEFQSRIENDVKIKSFADISGIHIYHNFYDELENKGYGFVCISEDRFLSLQEENRKKHKEYIYLMSSLKKAINNGDREKAENIIQKIKLDIPSATQLNSFIKLENELKSLINVNIYLKEYYKIRDRVIAKILTNQSVYLNVIFKKGDTAKLLVLNKNLSEHKTNKVLLIKMLNSFYKGENKVIFLISRTPLNLGQFLNNRNILLNWEDYIQEFKSQHFLKIIEKVIKVKNEEYSFSLKNSSNETTIFKKFKSILKHHFKIVSQSENRIEYLFNREIDEDKQIIEITLKFYKGDSLLKEESYSRRFYKNQDKREISNYIIPSLYRFVKRNLNEFQ